MRADRLTELYERTIGSLEGQRLTRARIHWICEGVAGSPVLDVGCSQGTTAILLAREGHRVVGLDAQRSAIEFAEGRLALEEAEVQARAEFRVGQAQELPFEDGAFSTVIMGELIEHLIDPRPVLREARRVLQDGGTLVLTTPYGVDRSLDHKEPIYLAGLLRQLRESFSVYELKLIGKFIALRARTRSEDDHPHAISEHDALLVAETRLATQDEAVERLHDEARRRAEKYVKATDELREQLVQAKADAARVRPDKKATGLPGRIPGAGKAKSPSRAATDQRQRQRRAAENEARMATARNDVLRSQQHHAQTAERPAAAGLVPTNGDPGGIAPTARPDATPAPPLQG